MVLLLDWVLGTRRYLPATVPLNSGFTLLLAYGRSCATGMVSTLLLIPLHLLEADIMPFRSGG